MNALRRWAERFLAVSEAALDSTNLFAAPDRLPAVPFQDEARSTKKEPMGATPHPLLSLFIISALLSTLHHSFKQMRIVAKVGYSALRCILYSVSAN